MTRDPAAARAESTALGWIEAFCAGDLARIESLLAPELEFRGSLMRADSAADYLARLRADPPQAAGYEVLAVVAAPDAVAVFYRYRKPGAALTLAQWFGFRADGLIDRIRLVFDPAESARPG